MNTTNFSRTSSSDVQYAVQMPLDERAATMDRTVQELLKVPKGELRRAHRHHRRALRALRDGCYGELAESTREQLVTRLRTDLEALERALRESGTSGDGSTTSTAQTSSQPSNRSWMPSFL